MVMDKKLNRDLMGYAEECLQNKKCPLYKKDGNGVIHESYNGQVSALGVSILMIGLRATLAVYYQDKPDKKDKAYRRNILEVIVQMLNKDTNKNKKDRTSFATAEDFVKEVMKSDEMIWKSDVINCSVALKQVIRTYKLG